jgi:hypothetical protein
VLVKPLRDCSTDSCLSPQTVGIFSSFCCNRSRGVTVWGHKTTALEPRSSARPWQRSRQRSEVAVVFATFEMSQAPRESKDRDRRSCRTAVGRLSAPGVARCPRQQDAVKERGWTRTQITESPPKIGSLWTSHLAAKPAQRGFRVFTFSLSFPGFRNLR